MVFLNGYWSWPHIREFRIKDLDRTLVINTLTRTSSSPTSLPSLRIQCYKNIRVPALLFSFYYQFFSLAAKSNISNDQDFHNFCKASSVALTVSEAGFLNMRCLDYWSSMDALSILVAPSCPTLCNPMDCSLPGSFVHGILQTRILAWVAIPFYRRSSWPRDQTGLSYIADRFFTLSESPRMHSRGYP